MLRKTIVALQILHQRSMMIEETKETNKIRSLGDDYMVNKASEDRDYAIDITYICELGKVCFCRTAELIFFISISGMLELWATCC